MSVQTYLDDRASSAVLSQDEKDSISTSISTLYTRLGNHFSADISERFKFGSFTRGTILPRSMDSHSDIDYMIVFKDKDSKPQTYINKLKRFAEKYYYSSEITQSHPTVVLKLNHIKFDLVPAIKSYTEEYIEEYRIPSSFTDWVATSPNVFNSKIFEENKNKNYKLKPSIRLLKYWNALSGYIYESYKLEQWAVDQHCFCCLSTRDYFFDFIEGLDLNWWAAQWRKDKLARAKKIISNTKYYEENDMSTSAESEIKKLIP